MSAAQITMVDDQVVSDGAACRIAADPDDAGRNAARDAWLLWTDEGRTVQIATLDGPSDFNDLLMAREARHG